VAEPLPVLETLVAHYRLGQRVPLPLFPETSYAFAAKERGLKGVNPWASWKEELMRSAALRRVFGANAPLLEHGPQGTPQDAEPSFAQLAREVMGPLLDHVQEDR
jgi:exonuclease V gamma subunit